MGLGRMTGTQSLTQICTNQTTSWLVHSLSIFGVRMSHGQIQTHQGLDLGETTTLPFIIYYVILHKAHI
jgi:hypothetical protein